MRVAVCCVFCVVCDLLSAVVNCCEVLLRAVWFLFVCLLVVVCCVFVVAVRCRRLLPGVRNSLSLFSVYCRCVGGMLCCLLFG